MSLSSHKKRSIDPFRPFIKELLEKFPNITGQRVYEELCVAGYEGGITILRDLLQKIRPRSGKEPVIRFETEAGRQGQMDWSPYLIAFKRTGKCKVQCFSYRGHLSVVAEGRKQRVMLRLSLCKDFQGKPLSNESPDRISLHNHFRLNIFSHCFKSVLLSHSVISAGTISLLAASIASRFRLTSAFA